MEEKTVCTFEDAVKQVQEDAREIITNWLQQASENLLRDGQIAPAGILLVWMPDDQSIVVVPRLFDLSDNAAKEKVAHLCKKAGGISTALAVAMITDGWRKNPETMEVIGETITVSMAVRGLPETITAGINYTRDETGNLVFEPMFFSTTGVNRYLDGVFGGNGSTLQ